MVNVREVKNYFRNYNKNLDYIEMYRNDLKESDVKYLESNKKTERLKNAQTEIIIRDLLYYRLNDKEKNLIDMRYKYEMDVEEISNELYCSHSTYYRKMRQIYRKLSQELAEIKEIIK
ncbi:hypothetical protein [uncultured Helcococcus sp.]|uniref:hypothetical protein n=1 Tax=uncultured Helcococcus sp. TaxID=1072508 RepID=UPI0026161B30|nr:hypothetical protein [uncultured Helcococcus sp.]